MEHNFHVRSISMPSRAHPTALDTEQEIQKLSILVSSSSMTAEMMCDGLKALERLYSSIDELLHLPGTEQNLWNSNNRRWLEQEVDASFRILDICASTKDMLLTLKEHVQDLQSEMRRKGDLAAAERLRSCMCLRKVIKKMINVCTKETRESSSKSIPLDECCKASEAMKAVSEARKIVVSLLCSLLASMSTMPKPKASRWSFVSKAMQKRRVSCEDVNGDQLEVMHQSLGTFESGLECLYKQLIQNRITLLNLLSI